MAPSTSLQMFIDITTCHHYSLSTPSLKPHQFIDLAKISADRGKVPLRFGECMIFVCFSICLFVVAFLGYCEYMFLLVFLCVLLLK